MKIKNILFLHMAASWPIAFKKDKDSMPVIKVTLEPPPLPYPQVQSILQTATDRKNKRQEELLLTLEKSFNDHADQAKLDITNLLDSLLKIFDDKTTLKKAVDASRPAARMNTFLEMFEQPSNGTVLLPDETMPSESLRDAQEFRGDRSTVVVTPPSGSQPAAPKRDITEVDAAAWAEGDGPLSFLEAQGIVDSLKQKLGNIGAPSLLVQLLDVYTPDATLESKIKMILTARDKNLENIFKVARDMFDEVATITKEEIKTNIQIQLNAFTADLDSIKSMLGGKLTFLEVADNVDQEVPPPSAVGEEPLVSEEVVSNGPSQTYDLPTFEAQPLSFFGLEPQQLNVAVGSPDRPYPTVADVVHNHLIERAAGERALRMKIVKMIQHLMATYVRILSEELRPRLAKAISTVSSVSSAINEM